MRRLQIFFLVFFSLIAAGMGVQEARAQQTLCVNIVPEPDYTRSGNIQDAIEAINNARRQEKLHVLQLPTNFYQLSATQQQFTLVNAERADRGLSTLTLDSTLMRIAQNYSKQLQDLNFFSHTSPIGGTFSERINSNSAIQNHYMTAAENLAGNPVAGVGPIYEYMYRDANENCGHRQNILTPALTHIGIGVANSDMYGSVSTQEFIASASWNPYKGSLHHNPTTIEINIKSQFNTNHTSVKLTAQNGNNAHIVRIRWFVDRVDRSLHTGTGWNLALNKLSKGRHTIFAYGVDDEQNYGACSVNL